MDACGQRERGGRVEAIDVQVNFFCGRPVHSGGGDGLKANVDSEEGCQILLKLCGRHKWMVLSASFRQSHTN